MILVKSQLIAALSESPFYYTGIGEPENPNNEGPINGVTKYIVNVLETGLSDKHQFPTAHRKNITFYVENESCISQSATSLVMGIGTHTLTIGTQLPFASGMKIGLKRLLNYMYGTITSYNILTGELVVDITEIDGSGTYTNWLVSAEHAYFEISEPGNQSDTNTAFSSSSYMNIANLYNSAALQSKCLAAVITQCKDVFTEGDAVPDHENRMLFVAMASKNLLGVTMRMMTSLVLDSTVQTCGATVEDSVILSIISGSWNSYANLQATYYLQLANS